MVRRFYNSCEGLSEEDEENMTFLMISDPVNFEEAVKSPKAQNGDGLWMKKSNPIKKKSNMELGGSMGWSKENRSKMDL